jgi:hypothetical protein
MSNDGQCLVKAKSSSRVSCSYDSAIFLLNEKDVDQAVDCYDVGERVESMVEFCLDGKDSQVVGARAKWMDGSLELLVQRASC